jgi:hypothetical protein
LLEPQHFSLVDLFAGELAPRFGSARAVTTPASSPNRSSPLKTHDQGGVLEEACVIGAYYIGQHLPVGSETTHVDALENRVMRRRMLNGFYDRLARDFHLI